MCVLIRIFSNDLFPVHRLVSCIQAMDDGWAAVDPNALSWRPLLFHNWPSIFQLTGWADFLADLVLNLADLADGNFFLFIMHHIFKYSIVFFAILVVLIRKIDTPVELLYSFLFPFCFVRFLPWYELCVTTCSKKTVMQSFSNFHLANAESNLTNLLIFSPPPAKIGSQWFLQTVSRELNQGRWHWGSLFVGTIP